MRGVEGAAPYTLTGRWYCIVGDGASTSLCGIPHPPTATAWLPLTRELSSASETEGEKNQNFYQTSSLPPAFCSRKNPPPSSEGGKNAPSRSPAKTHKQRTNPHHATRCRVLELRTQLNAEPHPHPARTRATPARFHKNGKPPRGFVRARVRVRLGAGWVRNRKTAAPTDLAGTVV